MVRLSNSRFLALDIGGRRIGVAAGSLESGLAIPLEVIDRSKGEEHVWKRLRELVARERTGTVIVGDPVNMDGTIGAQSAETRLFADLLKRSLRQVRVRLVDERLSSFIADEWMDRDGVKPSQKRARRDAYAAAVILQDFLREHPPQ